MSKNPAKISKRGHYKQGIYKCVNPDKYICDHNNIIYRSGLEFRVCYKLDRADNIIAWATEYIVINYLSPKDGLMHRYFTDFITVALNENKEKIVSVIEVKPEKEKYPPNKKGKNKSRYLRECLTYEINQAKWSYARKYCEKRGWNFVVLSEKQILGSK